MHSQSASPIDGTPRASLRQTVLVIIASFLLAFALDPGSFNRWAYMLTDSNAVRPVQVAAEATSDAVAAAWRFAGLRDPYDILRDLAQRTRQMIGGNTSGTICVSAEYDANHMVRLGIIPPPSS